VTGVSPVVVVVDGTVVGGLVVVVGGAVGGTVVTARVVGVRTTDVDVVVVVGDFEEFECVTTSAITIAATAMMIATTMMVRLLTGAGFFPSGDSVEAPGCAPGGCGDPLSYVTGENVARRARLGLLSRLPPRPGRSDPPGRPMSAQRVALPAKGALQLPAGLLSFSIVPTGPSAEPPRRAGPGSYPHGRGVIAIPRGVPTRCLGSRSNSRGAPHRLGPVLCSPFERLFPRPIPGSHRVPPAHRECVCTVVLLSSSIALVAFGSPLAFHAVRRPLFLCPFPAIAIRVRVQCR
jgi:hypothetical protein